MKNLLLIFLLAFVVFSCKDKDPVIDDADIIGTWKRVSYVTINGTDSSFANYSETIRHYYNSNGSYNETKSGSSIYTSNANYEFTYINEVLKFSSMGTPSHEYPAVITGNVMIIDIGTNGSTKYSYELHKE